MWLASILWPCVPFLHVTSSLYTVPVPLYLLAMVRIHLAALVATLVTTVTCVRFSNPSPMGDRNDFSGNPTYPEGSRIIVRWDDVDKSKPVTLTLTQAVGSLWQPNMEYITRTGPKPQTASGTLLTTSRKRHQQAGLRLARGNGEKPHIFKHVLLLPLLRGPNRFRRQQPLLQHHPKGSATAFFRAFADVYRDTVHQHFNFNFNLDTLVFTQL